ncbi:hypothetical protein [Ideonella livida]|uniref:Tetratricopeptide repeat protein n=1 Tax=Ideonella livida TaxID=2707176 RepID=A0A7C9TJL8_9BURK|nr:hypothetical protein [Ideonella livida]NDY91144.1 hypothetical protein [Ideonella livida]
MAFRLIERLDQDIVHCTDPETQECLKAERAGALARHGLIQEARFALSGVRTQNQRLRSTRVATWIALVEGLIQHSDTLSPEAADKFQRAVDLAVQAAEPGLQALALAWLATVNFNRSELVDMARQLSQAVALAPLDHHAAWARIGLVLADTCRFAGADDLSRQWYQRARLAAGHQGDASMMGALLHNFATMRAARIGLQDAFGQADAEEARLALVEAESSGNYDDSSGSQALTAMLPLLRAQLLVVLRRHDEAVSLFGAHLAVARAEGMAHREARFLADRAWCHANTLRQHDAVRDAQAAVRLLPELLDADDQAAVHGRLAQTWTRLGRPELAAEQQPQAQAALAEHQAQQARLRSILERAGLGRPPMPPVAARPALRPVA